MSAGPPGHGRHGGDSPERRRSPQSAPLSDVRARRRTWSRPLSGAAQSPPESFPRKQGWRPLRLSGRGWVRRSCPHAHYVTAPRSLLGVVVQACPPPPLSRSCGLQVPAGLAAALDPEAPGASGGFGRGARARARRGVARRPGWWRVLSSRSPPARRHTH